MKKLFSTKCSTASFTIATFILRIGLGALMIPHGYSKLTKFASRADTFSDPFNIGSVTSMSLVIFAEFFCAAFILVGFLTRFASIPLIIAMSVALFYSHNADFFGEGEKASLFLCGYIALLFTGPGNVSLDRLIGK